MKFAVFGAGGIGAYLGGRLADAGHEVHLIARGSHLRALQDAGLRVESVAGDTLVELPATADPGEVGECDYVLFCVKSYDTKQAAAQIHPLVGDGTAVVSFQNGVDNEAWIAEEVGDNRVIGGVAFIYSTIKEPGVVEHSAGPARFVVGELDGRRTDRVEALYGALAGCEGVDAELADDITVMLWRKFAFICAHSGMTAATRLPIGVIRETPASWEMYQRLMREVASVARAREVPLPDGMVAEWLGFAEALEPGMYSSLYYDLTHEKPMEVEALHGSVVRHATAEGVEVPMTEAVYAILRPWADKFARE